MTKSTRSGGGLGYQPVKATYSEQEIASLFGFPERVIRGLARVIPGAVSDDGIVYDFLALTRFRLVRDLRARGLSLKRIEAALEGQLGLFTDDSSSAGSAHVVDLKLKCGPFEEGLRRSDIDDPAAEMLFRRAIEEGEHVADAYVNLGLIAATDGRVAEAFDLFTLALGSEPRHVEGQYNLGCLYQELGQPRLARLHYELTLIVEPGFANAYFNLGLACAELGDLRAARQALEHYKELAPDDGDAAIGTLIAVIRAAEEHPVGIR